MLVFKYKTIDPGCGSYPVADGEAHASQRARLPAAGCARAISRSVGAPQRRDRRIVRGCSECLRTNVNTAGFKAAPTFEECREKPQAQDGWDAGPRSHVAARAHRVPGVQPARRCAGRSRATITGGHAGNRAAVRCCEADRRDGVLGRVRPDAGSAGGPARLFGNWGQSRVNACKRVPQVGFFAALEAGGDFSAGVISGKLGRVRACAETGN